MILSKNKRVGIRAIEISDLKLIKAWRNNESLRCFFREYREFSFTQKENWYNKMIDDDRFEMFVIEDLQPDNKLRNQEPVVGVAGITYIDWVNKHGDVHFYIGKKMRRGSMKYIHLLQ